MDWHNIEYLLSGNKIQKKAYNILKEIGAFSILGNYEPVLVGTIPINIDISGSDLDIICNARDLKDFRKIVTENFSLYKHFSEYFKEDAYISSFIYSDTEIEIYAKNEPSILQNGYRHMLIEYRILNIAGDKFRQHIVQLKEQGYKTEPAFGKTLSLEEPYTELLELEKLSDTELKTLLFPKLSIFL